MSEVAAGCVRFCMSATAQAAVLAMAAVFARIADATVASQRTPLSCRTMRRGARSMVASPSVMRIGAGQLQGPRCSELFNRGTSVQPAVQSRVGLEPLHRGKTTTSTRNVVAMATESTSRSSRTTASNTCTRLLVIHTPSSFAAMAPLWLVLAMNADSATSRSSRRRHHDHCAEQMGGPYFSKLYSTNAFSYSFVMLVVQ